MYNRYLVEFHYARKNTAILILNTDNDDGWIKFRLAVEILGCESSFKGLNILLNSCN